MVVLTPGDSQKVPWHWHTNASDRFFCMRGPIVVENRAPHEVIELKAGEICAVPPRRGHRVEAALVPIPALAFVGAITDTKVSTSRLPALRPVL
jgi:mannose-6-phosphate isomerase-like protein (cupin superfamily)